VVITRIGFWPNNSINSLSSDDENENVSDKVDKEHIDVNSADVHESDKKVDEKEERHQGKISLIQKMSRLIDVGGSLGYDVRGCRKSLKKMINGIGVHIIDQ
nr:RNA-directed DNA polymerase, eukaryota, reverse transcriptase zinc-binding domain protein [Tanacetum cinerariifolium]